MSDKSVSSDRYKMLFLGIITIQILQVTAISGDQPLPESVYLNKYSIPIKPEIGSSLLNLSDLPCLLWQLTTKQNKWKSNYGNIDCGRQGIEFQVLCFGFETNVDHTLDILFRSDR